MNTQQLISPKIFTPNGYIKRGFDSIAYTESGEIKKSLRSEEDRYNQFFACRSNRKFRRGIIVLVKKGINSSVEIFRILKKRGFATRPGMQSFYCKTVCDFYIRCVRKKYGIPAKQKKDLIFDLHRQGKNIEEIRVEANTTYDYIKEIAQEFGFVIKTAPPKKKVQLKLRAKPKPISIKRK